MVPLTDEAALLYHVQRWGSAGYPVRKLGRGWIVDTWRSVKGPPVVYKTKRAAVAQFEAWIESALMRLRAMHAANPDHKFVITAVGIRPMEG